MRPPTASDREALENALNDLRALDHDALTSVATDLMMQAAAAEKNDRSGALLFLARIAYVLAYEGTRG